MGLIVNIYYKGKDGSARAFAQEMIAQGIVDEIRSKTGNLQYDYFLPLEDDEAVLLIDKWENQAALDEHHQSDTMQKIMALRQKYDLSMEVHRFFEDKDGIPESDLKYLTKD